MKRTVSQLSSCRTVPTTDSFGKHSQSGTLHNYYTGHTPLDVPHDPVYVQVTRLAVKHTTVVETQPQVSTWQAPPPKKERERETIRLTCHIDRQQAILNADKHVTVKQQILSVRSTKATCFGSTDVLRHSIRYI